MDSSVFSSKDGIEVTKSVSWTSYNGEAKDSLLNSINAIELGLGTNAQAGIYVAQKLLQTSSADMKYMVFMADGETNKSIKDETGPDIAVDDDYEEDSEDYNVYMAKKQVEIMKKLIPDVVAYTVGYTLDNIYWY